MANKKKKHHPVRNFFITIFVILLVIALPIGGLFLLLYDKTNNTRVYESTNVTELGSRALIEGFRNAPEKKKISVEVNKDDFNGVIVDLTSSMNIKQIKKVYVLKKDGQANFYMELEAKPLKTLLTFKTSVVSEGDTVELRIDEALAGKLKVSKKFVNDVLKMFKVQLPEQEQGGVKIDLKNWKISISKSLLLDSVTKGDGIITDVFKIIEDNALLSYNSEGNTTILSVDIDISKFQNNEFLTEDDKHMFLNSPDSVYADFGVDQVVAQVDSKMMYLINNAVIKKAQLEPVFKYLFNGYASCTEEQKNLVSEIAAEYPEAFEQIGIPDVTEYTSFGDELAAKSGNLLGNAEAQINFNDLSNQEVATISESDMNSYMRSKGIIGYTGVVSYEENEDIVKDYAFFVIDNFYCNIVNDHLYFVCGLNICGFRTNIVITMEKDDTQEDKTKAWFRLARIEYGEIDGEGLKNTIFDVINSGLTGDNMVGADKEKNLIYFNLQPIVDKVKEFDDYKDKTAEDISLGAFGAELASEGELKLFIH